MAKEPVSVVVLGREKSAAVPLVELLERSGEIMVLGRTAEPALATRMCRDRKPDCALLYVEASAQVDLLKLVLAAVPLPVVALVRTPFELALDSFEVAEAFEVPLAYLMNPAHHRRHQFIFEGGQRQFLSMPWQGAGADGVVREYYIWGATAAMLRNLYHFLAD